MAESRELHGRTPIYTNAESIDSTNIAEVLEAAMDTHKGNSEDIAYLWKYYRGTQPILDREKVYNSDINNKVVVNRFKQIVDFICGYMLANPIQYVDSATVDVEGAEENADITRLNMYLRMEDKEALDMELEKWRSAVGTAYRMPSPKDASSIAPEDADTSPADESVGELEVVTCDPRYTFVVYSALLGHRPMLGVTYVTDEDGNNTYYAYTDTEMFVLDNDYNTVGSAEDNPLGAVPIVEYPNNIERMGDAEPVVPILDAINIVESNRIDGVEQFVQAILRVSGMNIPDDFYDKAKDNGGMILPEGAVVDYLTLELNQTQTQVLADALWDEAKQIVGMPNDRDTGSTSSDTGSAVYLRDNWAKTETKAKLSEAEFKRSERRFLDITIDFFNAKGLSLRHGDVDIRFPRRNYTNDSANVDMLLKMLSSDWISPQFAYEHCNLTADPFADYLRAKAYHDSQEEVEVESLVNLGSGDDQTVHVDDGTEE